MSILLGIIGRGITFDIADLIWHWFDLVQLNPDPNQPARLEQLNQAIELGRQGKLEGAQQQLRLYLFDNPSCPFGRLASGALCLQQNQLADALEQLNSVYMRRPSNTMALYALGHCHERLGNEAQAIEFYQDCLKFKNFLQLPRQRLAAIHFKNSQLEKTIQEYELLRGEYPDDIPTLVALGHLYIAAEDYDRAIDTFNTAILIHPDNFLGADEEIEFLINQEQPHEALDLIETKLQDQPDNLELLVRQGDIYAMLAATTEAIESYQHAIRICPDLLEVTIKLGTQYLQMQQDEFAARQFNHAFEINDRVVDAYMGLAIAQKLFGRATDALATLSLAGAIVPNSAILFAQTACLQFNGSSISQYEQDSSNGVSPQLASAIQAHQQQLSIDASNPDLHYRLGLLLFSVGALSDAASAFQAVLRINPTFDRARAKLAVCLFEAGQHDLAGELLQTSNVLDSKTLDLHYRIALLYCDKLKFASSLLNLDQFMKETFTETSAAQNISVVLQNLGLLDRAVTTWENLTDTAKAAQKHFEGPDDQQFAF